MKKAKFLVLFLIIISSCGDSNDYIRNVYVDVEIDLSLPEFSPLNTVGNSIFIEGGNKGIIIYRFSNYEYNIYDRNCSYEPNLECSYIDSINSTIAMCGCCSSAFLLDQNGVAANSPAVLPLKQYNYSLNNTLLHIFN
ncbi:MAG: hypothetical protein ACJ0P8_05025 [Flavobacteriales bacterium]|jgi:hypothetical protein|tara:strand:+ start:1127 stop:1540 length:414 start_codon:yes stop_codon:yes gene_type:complete